MSAYEIIFDPVADAELHALRAYDHRTIRDAIDEKLSTEPLVRTKGRKPLDPVPPEIEIEIKVYLDGLLVPEVWQLTVGAYRVLYVVIEGETVYVLRVVLKGRLTTGEALS